MSKSIRIGNCSGFYGDRLAAAKEMIEKHIRRHKLITKILRITGWFGSYCGLSLILGCIPAMIRALPFGIGSFVQPLANIATSTIALSVSVGLSCTVMALAWLRFRPFLATALAFISGLGFFSPYIITLRLKRTDEVRVLNQNKKSS